MVISLAPILRADSIKVAVSTPACCRAPGGQTRGWKNGDCDNHVSNAASQHRNNSDASKIPGKANSTSQMRMISRSTSLHNIQPASPATSLSPHRKHGKHARRQRDLRTNQDTAEMSRPSESTPNQCCKEGPLFNCHNQNNFRRHRERSSVQKWHHNQ